MSDDEIPEPGRAPLTSTQAGDGGQQPRPSPKPSPSVIELSPSVIEGASLHVTPVGFASASITGGPAGAFSNPALSYEGLIRLLPAHTDEETYDSIRAQIAVDARLEDRERRILLQDLYEKETFGSRCEWCGRGNGGLRCVAVNDGLILAVCGVCALVLREARREAVKG